ncbi:uncharacterized protein LOC119909490 [Micropterus salmoides]|uniref:uncharacterized protein LOC119909490 n=1 Tax=Micropterus salmoides TaxID=27706 RepID=UPI0018EC775B|nr:uncharacterized protein LOC119909490 [Micropterus salmoides]
MVEFRWIIMSLFLMLVFRFPAATGQQSFIIRVEDEVTLSCKNVIDDKGKCDSTTWIFTDSRTKQTVLLFEQGQILNDAKAKSDRRVTEKCSLVIKKVTVEDVGLYTCRQFRSGQQQGEDSAVHLSVINMTEHQDADKVTLTCSVLIYEHCSHTVEWLYEGNKNDLTDMKRSQHSCSATVTFTTSDFNQKSKHPELFKCNVTDSYTKKAQLFPFSPQSSDGDATTTRSILTAAQTTTTMGSTTKQEGEVVKM